MIELFRHNKEAYEAAVRMLAERGKAAVIHPTGTGKSFIGFKLCEDNPDKTILWLSPSRYIYQTQLENLREVSEDYSSNNVKFYTYAKLMLMSSEEIAEIQPDYIILDEYHRVGAEQWGQGVDNVLKMYPDVPVLGLSATAVRYLDNQRNMTEELLDGNIASEMTLGEAIVRDILAPPKYILSIFSYQKDLERYEKRVSTAKSKAVQDAADKYLDALRRALDKAEKLDVLFDKHMTGRTGKYIVFCANLEHMQDMMGKAREWFRRVDKKPHIYSVYSDDPSASRSFAEFKADNDENHLKLLYCIDALNEGVHVPDISGVILLRPTISPIIYKQQIGRALCASKSHEPIIFDIVNNIENLYSIDSIKEEMQVAINYYHSYGKDSYVVNETFELIDKVSDCKALFEELEGTLSASWELMFDYAKEYYEKNGNLDVNKRYYTEDGYSLGSWLLTQRRVYNGTVNGILTQVQIDKLYSIGMRWESAAEIAWEKYYTAAIGYYEKNGDLKVPASFIDDDGVDLGRWLSMLRTFRKNGIRSNNLTPERIADLDKIGMIWDVIDYLWEENYAAAVCYHKKHGNLDVSHNYVDEDGIKLGIWLTNMRSLHRGIHNGRLTDDQAKRLEELGICWETKTEKRWNDAFDELCAYKDKYGTFDIPVAYVTDSDFRLGSWVRRQRDNYEKGQLSNEHRIRLEGIGFDLKKYDMWEQKYQLARKYYEEHGNLDLPHKYISDGVWLSKWLNEQKLIAEGKRKKKHTPEQLEKLKAIGFKYGVDRNSATWYEHYAQLKKYYDTNGNIELPTKYMVDGIDLNVWLCRQRALYRSGELQQEYIDLLNELSIIWETAQESAWNKGFVHLEEFIQKNGADALTVTSVCEDGYKLGAWYSNCKKKYAQGKIEGRYLERFKTLGVSLECKESRWDEYYSEIAEYFSTKNVHRLPTNYRGKSGINLYGWLSDQKKYYKKGKLNEHQRKALEDLGVIPKQSTGSLKLAVVG